MSTTAKSIALPLAAAGLLLFATTGNSMARSWHHPTKPTCDASCQSNKAIGPGANKIPAPTTKGTISHTSSGTGKNLRLK